MFGHFGFFLYICPKIDWLTLLNNIAYMMKKLSLFLLMLLLTHSLKAAVVEIEGVYYNLVTKGKVAEVTAGTSAYTGVITIPGTVDYEGVTYDVTAISDNAFANCVGVTDVTIGDKVTSIGEYAFSRCTGLTSLVIGSGVKTIGQYAFFECTSLSSLTIPDNVTTMGSSVLSGCTALTSVDLSANLTGIGVYAFYNCESLSSITIPASVTTIGEKAFSGCKELSSLVIPSSVTEINNSAFERCSGLTSVTIPGSITTCGNGIFHECTGLTSVTLPDTWTIIPNSTFKACTGLTSFVIPSGITEIGGSAFEGCSSLTSITIPSNVKTISGAAFTECDGLMTVLMEDGVETIGNDAFRKCGNLKELILPKTLTSIGYQSFFDCTSLTTVNIPENVTKIGDYAFRNCSALSALTLGESVSEIGNYAFENCSNITELVVPGSVSVLSSSAFRNCSSLSSLTISEGVTKIMNNAFQNCSSLKEVNVPNSVISIESGAFMECTKLVSVNIGSGIKTISSLAFSACEDLEKVCCLSTAVPYTFNDAFKDSYVNYATLYVRGGCKSVFQENEVWNQFMAIFEVEPIKIGSKGLSTFTNFFNLDFTSNDDVKAYVATGYDYDNNTIWLTRVKDAPSTTALLLKGPSNAKCEIPVQEASGSYFVNMFKGNNTSETMTIDETDGEMTNYYLKNGEYLSVSTSANIDAGKSYLQIPTTPPAAKLGTTQTLTMNPYGFATCCSSQDLDFSDVDGLKAYAATGYDDATGVIWLTRVKRVSAGTPLLLIGDADGSYLVPSEEVHSYYANMLKGNTGSSTITINPTDGDMTNYYLKGNELLKVNGSADIRVGKAYLQIPSKHVTRAGESWTMPEVLTFRLIDDPESFSVPSFLLGSLNGEDDGTTGISKVIVTPNEEFDGFYNLNGQRVDNPGRGIYIKNSRKVIFK